MTGRTTPDRSPWLFVPTQAFLQGIPQVMVMTVSAILLKSLGASNDDIGASRLMMTLREWFVFR